MEDRLMNEDKSTDGMMSGKIALTELGEKEIGKRIEEIGFVDLAGEHETLVDDSVFCDFIRMIGAGYIKTMVFPPDSLSAKQIMDVIAINAVAASLGMERTLYIDEKDSKIFPWIIESEAASTYKVRKIRSLLVEGKEFGFKK